MLNSYKLFSNDLRKFLVLESGFGENERGIVWPTELLDLARKKFLGNFSFRPQCWSTLSSGLATLLRNKNSIEDYHDNTILAVEYSHSHVHRGRYVRLHCDMMPDVTTKNYDVVSLGIDSALRHQR